jgi:hypothetical protein
MSLSLQIVHDPSGTWSLHGLPGRPVARLDSLAATIDYARRQCAATPATIELIVDGAYAVIHQERGWPRDPVTSDAGPPTVSTAGEGQSLPAQRGLRNWLLRWGQDK